MILLSQDKGFLTICIGRTQDKKTLKKINALLADIQRNGAMQGIGKPEPLKYRPGYSRRSRRSKQACI